MAYCLIKPLADAFKKALAKGDIDPKKLSALSSEQRREYFAEIVGDENAEKVNTLFEKKLLMKDFERGMIAWAKEVTGISPKVRASLIDRIGKMDERILNPLSQNQFLQDLAAQRIGADVTFEEAKQITELSNKLKEARSNFEQEPLGYGVARIEMENYLNDIKRQNEKLTIGEFKSNPVSATGKSITTLFGIAKSLKASLDMSAFLRQGGKVLMNNPKIWAQNIAKTFKDAWGTMKNRTDDDTIMDGLKAQIYSRDNSFNGKYSRMKLAIGTGEEAYPTSLPSMIPAFGRVFKASEVAYEGFLTRLRADLADYYLADAEARGVDIESKEELEAIGQLINSMTGRGKINSDDSGIVNAAFFSPKFLKANIDFFTGHQLEGVLTGKRTSTQYTRRQAAKNLARYLGAAVGVALLANELWPDSVETDPTSSDFGKIKIGDTRFDISGGISPVATLIARVVTRQKKSSTTGAKTDLGSEFGQTSIGDLFGDFASNKLSPGASALKTLITREDNSGNAPTLEGMLNDLFTPLPIQNYLELKKNPNSAPKAAALLADFFGIATNTYGDTTKVGERFKETPELSKAIHDLENMTGKRIQFEDWETSKNAQVEAFKKQFNTEDNKASALMRYNFHIQTAIEEALASEKFKNFTDEDKMRYINQIDTDAREKVFQQFNFRYVKPKGLPQKKLKL